jgi:hypothetical protein
MFCKACAGVYDEGQERHCRADTHSGPNAFPGKQPEIAATRWSDGESAWAGKPAGVLGVSSGAIGTAMAQQHLRNILAYLDMPTLGQPEALIQAKEGLFEVDDSIGAASRKFLQECVDRYISWVKRHGAQTANRPNLASTYLL